MTISRRPTRAKAQFGSPLPSPREGITYTLEEARNKYQRFFKHYGVSLDLTNRGEQFQGDCPFPDCIKPESHFYVSVSRGQWDCKHCGLSGNIYSFMALLYQQYSRRMKEADYTWLEKQRPGIDAKTFRKYNISRFGPSSVLLPSLSTPEGFARSETGLLSLPIYRELSNDDNTVSYKILNPPIVSSALFGLQFYKPRLPIFICEGQWDTLALHSLLSRIKKGTKTVADSINILGVPGSSTFPTKYLSLLSGVDVSIVFDNDAAGSTGQEKLISMISNEGIVPRSIQTMSWPAHYETGFDIRDLVHNGVN